jgi:tetratricopeptide (TPR) repeat protein
MTSRRVAITGVHDLSEAVAHYYGEQFRKKLKQMSRRKVLKGALAAVPFAPIVFSAFRNIFMHPVSDHDLQLLECARDLYTRNSDYHSATIILHAILHRFQQDNSSTEVVRLKACALWALGIIYLQQDKKSESLVTFSRAFEYWKAIHERTNQADMLLRIGEVYRYTVAMDGIKENGRFSLQYYQQATQLLHPSMTRFSQLQGQCYGLQGYLYYWLDEYELAEQYTRKGVEVIDEIETDWVYQTLKQYYGLALVKVGKYDEAFDILHRTSSAAVLQSPYYQARSCLANSELFLAVGDMDKGLEWAEKSQDLCKAFGLQGQQRLLTNMLAKYRKELQEWG